MKKSTCHTKQKTNSFEYGIVLFLIAISCIYKVNGQTKSVTRSIDTTLQVTQKKTPAADQKVQNVSVSHQQYPITISKKIGEEQVVHDETYLVNELQRIEYNIYAIDDKVSSVSSDPQKKEWAEKNGWFEQMNKHKASLIERKQVIKQELEIIQK